MTTLDQRLRHAQGRLEHEGIDDPRLEAELLWMEALQVNRAGLLAGLTDAPAAAAEQRADALLARRLDREPTAYLLGRREFYGLELQVAPGVLVPRPETETVVEEALRLLAGRGSAVVADVGTGSGAIAISIALYAPQTVVHAIDISETALGIARANAMRHGVAGRVRLLQGDLLAPVKQPLDLVVANLPYVASAELAALPPEVRCFEPREALDGGNDGLEVIGRLLRTAGPHLRPSAALVLESDPRQVDQATELAKAAFPGADTTTTPDLTGRPRVLTVRLP